MEYFDYDTEAAAAMIGKGWRFSLNSQMKPIACVITGVHLLRDRPRFDIDLNVDTGEGRDETYHTRLQNVEARFLYRSERASLSSTLGQLTKPQQ